VSRVVAASTQHLGRNLMSKFTAGDQVVAVKEIGGFLRDHIPKGARSGLRGGLGSTDEGAIHRQRRLLVR
jgi:hypothetical protein